MYNNFSNECSIFKGPFRVNARNVEGVIDQAPGLAAVKDINGKYWLTSQHEASFSGFTPDEFAGLTIEDISERAKFMKSSKNRFINTIKEMDHQVKIRILPVFMKEIYITYDGFIKIDNLMKSPILGHNNKVVAILSYCEDLTLRSNLFDVFLLYKKFYSIKEGIIKFLAYFNILSYFQEMPTYTEMLVIIAMSLDHRHKSAAALLKKKLRTIVGHSSSINQKLKAGLNIYDILTKIRNAGKNTVSLEDWLID